MADVTHAGSFRWQCLLWIYMLLIVYLLSNLQFDKQTPDPQPSQEDFSVVFSTPKHRNSASALSSESDSFHIPTWNLTASSGADDWPPLDSLVSRTDNTSTSVIVNRADVSFLLDFVIIGHGLCGTNYLQRALNAHSEVALFQDDHVCKFLYEGRPADLVRSLYTELPTDVLFRGFHCNDMLFSSQKSWSLRYFSKFFDDAKLIVGVQHPVLHFQSQYNFRCLHPKLFRGIHRINVTANILPAADMLIGKCRPEFQGVCTDNAKFHVNLVKLGKTNYQDTEEKALLNWQHEITQKIPYIKNDLFLYDFAQLYDENQTRLGQFNIDLQEFLGLSLPLNISVPSREMASLVKPLFNICESKYLDLRQELLGIGKNASRWILYHLLKYDNGVSVSNPDFFGQILQSWEIDPCSKDNGSNFETLSR
jgi:hypothetical protein